MVMRFGPEYLTYVKRCGYDTLTLVVGVRCGEAKMTRYIVPNIPTSSFVIADICKIH